MYGRLATECGYRPKDIDEMLLDDVLMLTRYWQRCPPPGALIRSIAETLGIEFSTPPDTSRHMTEAEARAFMARTGGMTGKMLNG